MGSHKRVCVDKTVKVLDGEHKGLVRKVCRVRSNRHGVPQEVKLAGLPGYIHVSLIQVVS